MSAIDRILPIHKYFRVLINFAMLLFYEANTHQTLIWQLSCAELAREIRAVVELLHFRLQLSLEPSGAGINHI